MGVDHYLREYSVRKLALNAVISFISGTISKCEFKTFVKGEEVKSDRYYRWNVSPNVNESASQFINHWLTRLIMDNESLIIVERDQFLVADSFSVKKKFAVYPDIFSGVMVSDFLFDRDYLMSDVLYFKLAEEPINRIVSSYYDSYKDLISKATASFSRTRSEQGIITIDGMTKGGEEANARLAELMSSRFKNYFSQDNVVVPLEAGVNYQRTDHGSMRQYTDASDIRTLIDDVLDMTAIAFKIPPDLLKGGKADREIVTNYLTFCIDPLAEMLMNEINRKCYTKSDYLDGSYVKIDTRNVRHVEIFEMATAIDKLISSGALNPNEVRKELDFKRIDEEWADAHWMTLNYDRADREPGSRKAEEVKKPEEE